MLTLVPCWCAILNASFPCYCVIHPLQLFFNFSKLILVTSCWRTSYLIYQLHSILCIEEKNALDTTDDWVTVVMMINPLDLAAMTIMFRKKLTEGWVTGMWHNRNISSGSGWQKFAIMKNQAEGWSDESKL